MLLLVTAPENLNSTYKPRQLGDLTGLRIELPPLPNGADPWIQSLKSLTQGSVLAMGDRRAIVSTGCGTHTLVQIEAQARTGDVPANAPVTDHDEAFFNTM